MSVSGVELNSSVYAPVYTCVCLCANIFVNVFLFVLARKSVYMCMTVC